ncbi:MAG TPA: type II secretion system protein [Armatimonadota bacterium]|nr:type II secretion system protein [Armatimonadota bacterium]
MAVRTKARVASGFTLIELLVVIGIIGILASMLFPVFASARKASHKVVCQSNLRQIYAAFQLYVCDWDDRLPCPGGLTGDLTYWAQENGGGIDRYLKCQDLGRKSVYCCPSYAGEFRSNWSPRTYGMNSFLREPPDVAYPYSCAYLTGIGQSRIKAPSSTILLYEGMSANGTNPLGEGYVYRCGNWTCVRGYYPSRQVHWQDAHKPWHGTSNNYLMCDGHIVTMPPEKYGSFPGPTSPANNLWYAERLR